MADPSVERNGAAPVAINNGHSRKGSLMGDVKKGNLAFGTVDSPNPLLSSSPAAPSVTGQHLSDNVKSFGTIEADGTDPNSVKPPSRRTSGLNTPMSPPMQQKKSFDMHAGFKPQQAQQPQQVPQPQQPLPQQGQMPYFRPPMRSPPTANAVPPYPVNNFRPPPPMQQQQQPVRPAAMPARPQYVPQGYPQQQYMYPQQNFYPPQYGYEQQYGMPPQQFQVRPQSPNPGPTPSPPAVRPGPSTPQRPPTAATPYMSGGATAFTPRKSAAISFKRADGTEVDLKSVAAEAAAKKPTVPATPEPGAKKVPSLPVVVRLETPEQKAAREKEDAERKRIKELEEKEEIERKERKERQAREAEAAKAEAEAKEEAARKEKEETEKKEAEAKEAALKEAEAKAEADKKASEEAARRGMALDSQAPSAVSSPLASPRLGSAGLPPKPSRPTPIETTPSPLATARPIEDLSAIKYPEALQPPSPSFNAGSEPGKYRYDRDFLLQFMEYCKERPEGMPQLAEILEAGDSGFGRRKSGPARGGPPAAGGRGMPSMGSFGMGSFNTSTTAGTTSEMRYARASSQMGMKRQPSQGGFPHGLPPMAPSSSRGGHARSQRGQPRRPANAPMVDPNVAPLQVSLNSWVKARPTDNDENSPAFVERKVKSLLNKLTAEKFDSISKQILDWANKSSSEQDAMSLKLVIKLVFDKATDEAHWSAMYAKLCRMLHDEVEESVAAEIDGKMVAGRALVRKTLIGRCQMDFEAGWTEREAAAAAAAAKSTEDKERMAKIEQDKAEGKEGEAEMLSDEYYAAQKAKRRGLGLVQLIGEIYKLDMLSRGVIRRCLQKLLPQVNDTNPDEDDIESAVKLLTTIGGQFESQDAGSMEVIFQLLDGLKDRPSTPSRIRFMIMDLKDLRAQGWVSKKGNTVMTIAEIHQQAAKEQVAAAQKAAKSRESISRGGSKTGHRRDGPGEWQSVAPAARLPSRPADMSGLGRNLGSNAGPSFGPSSVFNKRKGANTPPMSRQASTTNVNMFSALNDAESAAAPEPERPKLNLQARTKPMPEEEAEEEEAPKASMGAEAAKSKIDSDMKELWGEKDAGGSRNSDDIVEYFTALPEEHQPTLAVRLVDDVFRIAKYPDAQVVADGMAKALEAGISADILRQGLDKHNVELDDEAIDYPQAYKSFALILRSIKLDGEVEAFADKIAVDGTPRITPKDKLLKAMTQLDE